MPTAETILLDTHALLWRLAGDSRLPPGAGELIAEPANRVLVSAVSAWEISIKRENGRLEVPDDLLSVVTSYGLEWISITPEEAMSAGGLPPHHRDPFDRLLVAQARIRRATLISGDKQLDDYAVTRYWS